MTVNILLIAFQLYDMTVKANIFNYFYISENDSIFIEDYLTQEERKTHPQKTEFYLY